MQQEQQVKISDYLHLYLGCEIESSTHKTFLVGFSFKEGERWPLVQDYKNEKAIGTSYTIPFPMCKPMLRKLDYMTKEEHEEFVTIAYNDNFKLKPLYADNDYNSFHWLLNKSFDLFGLIELGLALDSTGY